MVEVTQEDYLRLEEIVNTIQQPERFYDYAWIKGAIIKENEEWKSFVTKITVKRKRSGERVSWAFKKVLERPNFLIFRHAVSIKKLIEILRDLVHKNQFTINGYVIKSEGRFNRRMFLYGSRKEDDKLAWPADAYYYSVRGSKPGIPDDLRLKRDSFLDVYHAVRELVGFKRFDSGYYTGEAVLLLLPYYFVKISKCEVVEKKLVLKLEPYHTSVDLEDLKVNYFYGVEYRAQDRGEITPLRWENEVLLPYVPNFVHVLLFLKGFADPVDEYYLYLQAEPVWPKAVSSIEMTLPDMFRELEAVLGRAGFRDAKAKIVLAAATNLVEVVVTKKLMDLGEKTTGKLNDKISRVVEKIESKENKSITKELIPYVIKVTRDKADHAGFDLLVRDEDAIFMLKRTIDFLRQLYE